MTQALALQSVSQMITQVAPPSIDSEWLLYFDRAAAMTAVAAHVAQLPSSRTDEKHTLHVYEAGLKYFQNWIGFDLPTEDKLTQFIAHLSLKGLKVSTINSKYLAPTRLYLTKLAGQRITSIDPYARMIIQDARENIRAAAEVKSPRAETTSNIAPLWRAEFTRLTIAQVNATLRAIDNRTLAGLRDYALLHVAFSTGLRLAELARITPAAITREGEVYIITVRGKRSNIDPVPMSPRAYADIQAWITAFNADLPAGDPRRITGDTPIWQPLTRSSRHQAIGTNGYAPARGMSHQALRDMIGNRTASALGEDFRIAAHDTRRTTAAIAYESGMDITDIQQLLRHKDAATTLLYVGKKPNFAARALGTRVSFG